MSNQSQSVTSLSADQPSDSADPEEAPKKKVKLFSYMDSSYTAGSSTQANNDDLALKMRHELAEYMKCQPLDYDSDPLIW